MQTDPRIRLRQVGLRLFSNDAQYASMNEFTCSEHSVRIRSSKKRRTGNQSLDYEWKVHVLDRSELGFLKSV